MASADPQFSTLVAAAAKAGLVEALSDKSAKLTVFAPTNAAFEALLGALGVENGLDGLSAAQLKPILLYHVLGTEVRAAAAAEAAAAGAKVDALGGKVALSSSGGSIWLDGKARVVAADVMASNGVIHAIDEVILPSIADIATTDPSFSSLATALTVADSDASKPGLVAALDDDAPAKKFTVFAPPNAAFDALVTALKGSDDGATTGISTLSSFKPYQLVPVLKYHVYAGGQVMSSQVPASAKLDMLGGKASVAKGDKVTIDGAEVTAADLVASNGVIHAIGSVILPSISDVVTTAPEFSALAGAVVAADTAPGATVSVGGALDGTTAFTLFAPTNAAFAALGAAPSGQALTDVLLYHAVSGSSIFGATAAGLSAPLTLATALANESFVVMAEGSPKQVTIADGTMTKAKVVATDYFTANGVIHSIDKVLIP